MTHILGIPCGWLQVLPYSLKVFGAQNRQLLLRAMQVSTQRPCATHNSTLTRVHCGLNVCGSRRKIWTAVRTWIYSGGFSLPPFDQRWRVLFCLWFNVHDGNFNNVYMTSYAGRTIFGVLRLFWVVAGMRSPTEAFRRPPHGPSYLLGLSCWSPPDLVPVCCKISYQS